MRSIKKVLSFIVAIAILIGLCPGTAKEARAESGASLTNLGPIGTLKAGKKTKSGNWWKIYVGGEDVFCLNMGYTCHSGDVYNSQSTVYSTNGGAKESLRAYIGYWFDQTKKRSNKSYIFAQALLWSVEEGDTSESQLKEVIQTMKNHTGYYSDTETDELFRQIFKKSGTLSVKVNIWKYGGPGSHRQELMEVRASEGKPPKPHRLTKKDVYRQRITLDKKDEHGKPIPGVEFLLTAQNIDELYYFKANGWGDPESGDVSEDIDHFQLSTKTDSNGRITYRFNYHIQSKDYYYYTDDELKTMDAKAKEEARNKLRDEGYLHDDSLTEGGAEDRAKQDIAAQMKAIRNRYEIREVSTGNDNLLMDPEYGKGKLVTLDGSHSWHRNGITGKWPDDEEKSPGDYRDAYKVEVRNSYKKVRFLVGKEDGYSKDKKAHGDASLDGAVFRLCEDAACTERAYVYRENGEIVRAGDYTTKDGFFQTDYLQSGKTYYLKEIAAPAGYKIKKDVIEIRADGRLYNAEYTKENKRILVSDDPVLGKIALQKFTSDGSAGPMQAEKGAQFEVYLESAGSYAQAGEYERDIITIGGDGYGCTKDLYYGRYIVHQTGTGGSDTEKVKDFSVVINDGDRKEPYTFPLHNPIFKAYLRVVKKDGNTEKTVLKPGTSYQIFLVDKEGKESLVTQSFSDGHTVKPIDSFQTDESGVIMTVDSLKSGKYRIYEKQAAPGYHISVPYIEVDINSQSDHCEIKSDAEGKSYTAVTVDYVNSETYGRLSISKTGEQLSDFKRGEFIYKKTQLKGVVFDIYAEGDISTQDNQNTNWFEKGALVASVTTGESAEFTDPCGGICGYFADEQGMITVTLPLGRYRVVERKTNYGYVLSGKEWKVSFDWEDQEREYVLNSTDVTDESGVLKVENSRAKAAVSLEKVDSADRLPIQDAVFALYTKDNIYNAGGELLAEADTMLGTVSTDERGKADFALDLPLMSQGYQRTDSASASGPAVRPEERLNSGDYYLKELSVPDSYYCLGEQMPIHLEYRGDSVPVISSHTVVKDVQTVAEISKVSLAGGVEIPGCALRISDDSDRVIVSWITGQADSVRLSENQREQGYENLRATMDEKGNLHVGGLLHDREYILSETRPADGYATAENITFRIVLDKASKEAEAASLVQVKDGSGVFADSRDNMVRMADDTTKVEFRKLAEDTGKLLEGAEIAVYDSEGNKVEQFLSSGGIPTKMTGLLRAGETYTFRELSAPEKYSKAADVSLTVKDSGEIQEVVMTDRKLVVKEDPKTPAASADMRTPVDEKVPKSAAKPPKTGVPDRRVWIVPLLFLSAGGIAAAVIGKRKKVA